MSEKRKYDATVARVAGNIASGWVNHDQLICRGPELMRKLDQSLISELSVAAVALARAIVAEVERTDPAVSPASDPQTEKR